MKALVLMIVCGVACPIAARAQQDRGQFFVFGAPAQARSVTDGSDATQRLFHVGGGGEAALAKGGGVGVEIGGLGGGHKAAILSANGFGHIFGQHHLHLDPYLTAGVTLLVHDSRQKSGRANVGAGLNYWFAARRGYNLGLELGYRRYLLAASRAPSLEVRIGLRLWVE